MRDPDGAGSARPRLPTAALLAPALAAGAASALERLGVHSVAGHLSAAGLGLAALLVVAAVARLALRARADRTAEGASTLGWALLGTAAAAAAGASLWAVEPTAVLAGAAGLAAAGVLLLPAPAPVHRGWARTVVDAGTAGAAGAVPVTETLAEPMADTGPWRLLAAASAVGLVAAAVAAVARARRPGGLALLPLGLVAGGAALLATGTVIAHDGAGVATVSTLLTAAMLLWAAAAYTAAEERPENDRTARWRERVAVLVPLAPTSIAASALAGAVVAGWPLPGLTVAAALVLAAALVSGGVLARLDSLVTERSLDDLVQRRTLSLGEREKWFRALVQNSSDVITVVDARATVRYMTPSVTRILGHEPEALVGSRLTRLLRPPDGRRLEAALLSAARTPGVPSTLEFPVWAADGSWCDTETTVTSLLHDPDIRGLVLNTRDVSERRRLEEQLTRQAFSDGLTGLANRSLFRDRVQTALRVALAPREVAVLFLDMDGFKAVNDAQGHHVGDELLTLVAKRLTSSVRPGDVVARLGGDEFAVLVTGPGAEQSATWVAERIQRALGAPFVLDGREVSLGASLGLAVSDSGDETADQILRNADLAMYRAKGRHARTVVRFEAAMHDALLARVEAERELRQAVARGHLALHYQPVVELMGARIVGVEALVRWQHPELGTIGPAEFIGLAEETGLILDIGRWALRESARQATAWQRFAAPGGSFKVAVNVSARQLEPGLPRFVRDLLAESGLPGHALTLEMTESVLMDRTEEVVALLGHLKTMGVRVAVDDFGTGYSSLSYLSRFPVDVLKIDKSFVQHVAERSGEGELVATIVALGRSLRLDTVAEGIETTAQRAALEELGCTHGQGYLFARPMPAADVEQLLERQAADVWEQARV